MLKYIVCERLILCDICTNHASHFEVMLALYLFSLNPSYPLHVDVLGSVIRKMWIEFDNED